MYRLTTLRQRLAGGLCGLLDADQEGQGMVEYAFILTLIAVILIVIVTIIGNQSKNMWSDISVQFR